MNHTAKRLEGKHVAFTGRLASMPRADAFALVRAHGGVCDQAVSRATAILVVGQEGWPLRKNGRVCKKLLAAKKHQSLGRSLVIQTEEEWLAALGLHEHSDGIHRRFTSTQLGRLLKLPRQRLAAWVKAGLIAPAETIHGVHFFDFQQVASLRTLWEMTQAGVTHQQLARSFERLARWLPALGPAPTLAILERDGQILVRLAEGLADASGQLEFDFPDDETTLLASNPLSATDDSADTADDWYNRGTEFESQGDFPNAIRAYRRALLLAPPSAEVVFNLGNALYASGQIAAAAERFRQAIELAHDFIEAWTNLGVALADMNQPAEAIATLRHAIAIHPDSPDARCNLAETLDETGNPDEAREHWRVYLRLEPIGEWAAYARRRLAE